MKNKTAHRYQKGNALFLVLIAILLFAALGIAATKSSNNTPSSDQHEANLEATRLLKWLSAVKAGVTTTMMVNETLETNISFADPRTGQSGVPSATTNTENPNSRGEIDEIFTDLVTWQDFRHLTQARSTNIDLYNHIFTGGHVADGIGTTAADLVYFMRDVSLEVCQEVNKKAGLGLTDATMPSDTTISNAHFKGTYGGATLQNIDGKPFGCFLKVPSPAEYWIYYIILAR